MNPNGDMYDSRAATKDKEIIQPRKGTRVKLPPRRIAEFVWKQGSKT